MAKLRGKLAFRVWSRLCDLADNVFKFHVNHTKGVDQLSQLYELATGRVNTWGEDWQLFQRFMFNPMGEAVNF